MAGIFHYDGDMKYTLDDYLEDIMDWPEFEPESS